MTQEIDLEKYHRLALQKQKEHRKVLANLKKKPPKKKIKILNIGYLDLVIIVYIISPTVIAEVTINNAVDSCENNKHILIIVLNPISIFFTSIPFAILW